MYWTHIAQFILTYDKIEIALFWLAEEYLYLNGQAVVWKNTITWYIIIDIVN